MPNVVAAAGAALFTAVFTVTGSAAAATAVSAAVATLAFTNGIIAGLGAWATVASAAALARGRPRVGGNFGTQVDFKADPNAGIPYAIGETGLGGNIIFATTAETKNHHLLYLTVFTGAGPIEGITGFTANDEAVTFTADNAVGRYHNFMEERRQPGSQTPATFYPPATTLGSFTDWTDEHKLTGYAAQWWVLEYDTKKYPTGTPKPLTTGKWVKAYDPREDSTYPGGSGAQRAADEGTWTWTANPFLHALTWAIGRHANGKRILGVGAPIDLIDVAAFVEGANVCDANGWDAGGVVYSTDDKWQVLAAMLQAGGGWPTASGAKISCGVSAPKVSLATLTGADQAGGDVTISAVRARRDRFNAVIPRYRSTAHRFEVVSAAKISVPAYLAEDGGEESRIEPEFPLCPDVDQAAQLGTYAVANSREFGPIVIPCKPRWWGYRPNDCITVTEPEWGLNGQKCLILNRERDPQSGVVTLTLQTETDGKHDFALGKTGTPPPTPGLTSVDPTNVPLPDDGSWEVSATYLTDGEGTLPVLVITGAVDTGLVVAIIVDYREIPDVGPPGPWMSQEFPSSATNLVISGLKPNTRYQVRIRYRTNRGVDNPDDGTDLGEHVTGTVAAATIGTLTAADIEAAVASAMAVLDDLAAAKADVEQLIASTVTSAVKQAGVIEAVKKLGYTPEGLPLGPFAVEQRLRTDFAIEDISLIGVRSDDGLAFELSDLTLKIGDEVLADRLDVLYAQSADAFAQITTEASARAAGDTASASLVTALGVTVAANQAFAVTQFTAAATATTAVATELHLIGAQNGAGTAFVLDLSKVQTAPGVSMATRLSGLDSSISTANATIASEATTRASADSALSSSISTLSSTVGGFSATISTHTSAIATLDGKTQAYLEIVAAAGSDPAFLKLLATGYGSAIMLAAQEVALYNVSGGTLIRALKIVSGLAEFGAPVSVTTGSRRLTIGPGFGASSDLVMWFGPSSTAIGSMTKTNGYWAFATDGKVYYGTGELSAGGSGPSATLNHTGATYSNPGAGGGTYTTNVNNPTVTVTGNVGTPSFAWYCTDGFVPNPAGSPSGSTCGFTRVMAPNEDADGVATCVVSVDGKQIVLVCGCGIYLSP